MLISKVSKASDLSLKGNLRAGKSLPISYHPDNVAADERCAVHQFSRDSEFYIISGRHSHKVFSLKLDNEFAIVGHNIFYRRRAFANNLAEVDVLLVKILRKIKKGYKSSLAGKV